MTGSRDEGELRQDEGRFMAFAVASTNVLVGTAGLVFAVFFGALVVKVLRSPGDDNPVASVMVVAACLSILPALGLAGAFFRLSRPRLAWIAWLVPALAVLAVLVVVALRLHGIRALTTP